MSLIPPLSPSTGSNTTCTNDEPKTEFFIDILAAIASTLIILLYLVIWGQVMKRSPLRTTRGLMEAARRSWVASSMRSGMLPVNTMRDLIRVNQFYASSSLLVSLGAAGFATSASGSLHIKVLFLVAVNAISFILFLQAVRFYGHLEILINTKELAEGIPVTEELCYVMMNKATRFGNAGQRSLMITFPLLLWVFGPLALVLATIALVATWRALDWDDAGHRVVASRTDERAGHDDGSRHNENRLGSQHARLEEAGLRDAPEASMAANAGSAA